MRERPMASAERRTSSWGVVFARTTRMAPSTIDDIKCASGKSILVAGSPTYLVGEANDPEDGTPPCEELVWNVSIGHNAHAHPEATLSGCEVTYVPQLGEHATSPADLLFLAIELVHTDHGGPSGEAPLTARQGIRVDLAP